VWTLSVSFNYKRCKLTLGKIDPTAARAFAANIAQLQSHCKLKPDSIPVDLESWVCNLSEIHRRQLGEINLLSHYDPSLKVGKLIELFLDWYDNTDNQPSTKSQMRSAFDNRVPKLLKHKLSELEPRQQAGKPNSKPVFSESAKSIFRKFESWQREHYAKSTWSKDNGRLREVGKWAVEHGFLHHNPFVLLKKPEQTNPERNFQVPEEWILDTMDQSLDADTRISLALGRFAGLRTPSEARTLKWSMVNFESRQLQILDSKKLVIRTMPMFDRLFDELTRHQKETESQNSRFVLTDRYRKSSDANNFSLIKEAIARAGVPLWPKLRQNLRSSCENDLLAKGFKERLVTQWLGHSITVSRKHYQHLSDRDYSDAIQTERASNGPIEM
jgi:integrase